MYSDTTILVFGGTGHYGKHIVNNLIHLNHRAKVFSRNAVKARALLGPNVEIYEGDVMNSNQIKESMEECSAIIIALSAAHKTTIRHIYEIEHNATMNILDLAAKSGIKRVIYMSGYEMRKDVLEELGILDFGETKIEVENRIKNSPFHWNITGCAPSSDIFFAFRRRNRLMVPGGGLKAIPSIAKEDVGQIIAQLVNKKSLFNKRIRLCGPHAYSFPEVAQLMSKIENKEIKHKTIPLNIVKNVSWLLKPFNPFPRFLYKSLLLLNNFPEDLSKHVVADHQFLLDNFDYRPKELEAEIKEKLTLK